MPKTKFDEKMKREIDDWIEDRAKTKKPIDDMEIMGFINYLTTLLDEEGVSHLRIKRVYRPYMEKQIEKMESKFTKKEKKKEEVVEGPEILDEKTEEVDPTEDLEEKPEGEEKDFVDEPPINIDFIPPEKKEEKIEVPDRLADSKHIIQKLSHIKTILIEQKEEIIKETDYNYLSREFLIATLLKSFFLELDNLFNIFKKIGTEEDIDLLSEDFTQTQEILREILGQINSEKDSEVYCLYPFINQKIRPFLNTYHSFIKNMAILFASIGEMSDGGD